MYNITHNCQDFYLCSDYISTIFKDQSLEKFSIQIEKNCCGTTVYDQEVNLVYPDVGCLYQAGYCNFEEQQLCAGQNPREAINCSDNPLASYYFELREVNVLINGVNTQILNSAYDMTVEEQVIAAQDEINSYFQSNNFKLASAEITTYLVNTDYLCVDIQFKNLPNGVVPNYFLLANSETCYVTTDFLCLENQELTCTLKSSQNDAYSFTEQQIIDNYAMTIGKVLLEDNTVIDIPGVIFTTGSYLTSLEIATNAVNSYLASVGYTFSLISVINEDGSFYFTSTDPTVKGVYIRSTTSPNIEYIAFIMECVEFADAVPECIYKAVIDTNVVDYKPEFINAILGYEEGDIASTCVYSESVSLEDYAFSTIEEVDGVYTISIQTNAYVPDQVIMESIGGQKLFYDFICDEVVNFPDSYNPDILEFNGQCAIAKLGTLDDGIYKITITTETADEIITETYCCFVDCNVKCLIANLQDPKDVVEAYSLYETIKFGEECAGDCSCDNMCELYRELLSYLMKSPIYGKKNQTEETTSCGCSSDPCGCGSTYMWSNSKYSITS